MADSVPRYIAFFPNGTCAVCDQYGQQMTKYQDGHHQDTIRLLKADGYDWQDIEHDGRPHFKEVT